MDNPPTRQAPFTGDFDGDGDDDLLWVTEDEANFWFAAENGGFVQDSHPLSTSLEPLVADFDGNGITDVYWWSPLSGDRDVFWMMQLGGQILEREQPLVGDFAPVTFDPDGDGDAEILWYDRESGHTVLWISLGPRGVSGFDFGFDVGFGLVPTVLDPDGDARDDVLWYNPTRDTHLYWNFTAATVHGALPVKAAPGLETGAADLNGDGYDELVLSGGPTAVVAWGPHLDSFSWLSLGDLRQITFADTTGGGAAELVAAGHDGTVTRHGFALDRTQLTATPTVHGSQFGVTAADTNRDGRDELLVTTSGGFQRWSSA